MAIYESPNQKPTRATLYSRIQGLTNNVVSPETRQKYYSTVNSFASEQPLVASFIFIQLLLSFAPIALFASFALGTVALSFITALLFSIFWIGVALLLLVPVLFITVSLAIGVWIWTVSSFIVARWVYNLIPVNVKGGMEVSMPNGKTVVVNKSGEGFGDVEAKVKPVDPVVKQYAESNGGVAPADSFE